MLAKDRIWRDEKLVFLVALPKNNDARPVCVRRCGWKVIVFEGREDGRLEDESLKPMAADVVCLCVVYWRVERDRRLLIGVDARQSGRCGRWPSCILLDMSCPLDAPLTLTVVAILVAAMLSALVLVDRRRVFLRGEREDRSDCHTSGPSAAVIDCGGLVSNLRITLDMRHRTGNAVSVVCRTIARCQRHQAATRESAKPDRGRGSRIVHCWWG